jgi:hypothetical protein
VPAITSYASQSSVPRPQRKGAVLVGRMLMKLCCNSKFEPDQCVLNEIIVEFESKFEKFCLEVGDAGAQTAPLLRRSQMIPLVYEHELQELSHFLKQYETPILRHLTEGYGQDVVVNESDLSANDLYRKFKNDLTSRRGSLPAF